MIKSTPVTLALILVIACGTATAQDKAKTKAANPAPSPSPAAQAASSSPLKTEKEKLSYALGLNVASSLNANLKRQSVDIDPNILLQAFNDVFNGKKTLMTEDEARTVLTEFTTQLRAQQMQKMKEAGEANKKEGDAFLAANKTKPGVVTLPSGLQYKILKAGTGPKPTASDTVECNYKGTLVNGTEFDSSEKHGGPATFPVGGVIKGWTEALQLMPVGSKWQLFIPPDLAYGEQGQPPDIAPNATLIFEVELLSIKGKEEKK